ncbi:MAG: beta-ketoacyl-ACP synthase III [Bacteroidota bacterium]|nr:beta-ketoacyl-ACP synthase III [Bacteroidota bacterium]
MYQTKITGVRHYVPKKVVTNHDLEKLMDTSDEWIQERTGIKERHFCEPHEKSTAKMGAEAAKVAIERAGIDKKEIDAIVFATLSSDYFFPGSGVLMQSELGLTNIPAIDVRAQCSGFIYGLSIADQFIKTGMYKTILLVGSETQSTALDLTTRGRNMGVLFGDGAGAAILQQSEENGKGVLSTHLHADGTHAEVLTIKEPGTGREKNIYPNMHENIEAISPQMDGRFVFKNAIKRMPEAVMEALQANNLQLSDIDMLLPHQANLRISQMVQKLLRLPNEKIYNNIQKYGNTTAATIPIMMSELWEQNRIKEGDLYALTAFGSGFTWASALIRW